MYNLWIYTKWYREWEQRAGVSQHIKMIPLERVRSLNEDEKALLLYGLNTFYPSKLIGEITLNIIPCYDANALSLILNNMIKPNVKEESLPIYESLVKKLFGG